MVYVVTLSEERIYGSDSTKTYRVLGAFSTFERGLEYLRKFYEGDGMECYHESISTTETKKGEKSATAVRCWKTDGESPFREIQELSLKGVELDKLTDPFSDIE